MREGLVTFNPHQAVIAIAVFERLFPADDLGPGTAAIEHIDRGLRFHDTSGLYVFGGLAFPACPGSNRALKIWALCGFAAER